MKKNIIIAAAAALALTFTACQKEDVIVPGESPVTNARVKTTSDLHNTDWTYSVTTTEPVNSSVSYAYAYDGTTHTGYLDGVADDEEAPAQLQFTYDDATDAITFVLPMVFAEDGTPVNLTLVFQRNE